MTQFACIIHPLDLDTASSYEPAIKEKREEIVKKALEWTPSFKVSHVTGVRSLTGKCAEGDLILCTLLPEQILGLEEDFVIGKTIEACKIAEGLGAKIIGLEAFTAIKGKKGIRVAKSLNIPVTTGSSYTIAIAIEATLKAASFVGVDLSKAKTSIIGATGTLGSVCSQILSRQVGDLTLVARNVYRLNELATLIWATVKKKVRISRDIIKTVQKSDIIIIVTSDPKLLIGPNDLKPGSIVCDISRPRNVSTEVANFRDDVLLIDGGLVKPPGDVKFNFYFGLPERLIYACMAETMILALEERYESYSIGGNISIEKVNEISQLAFKHGFQLAEFRSCDKIITDGHFANIREIISQKRYAYL